MQTSSRLTHVAWLPRLFGLFVLVFALAACQPVQAPGAVEQEPTGTEAPSAGTVPGVGPAMATITADSLRVRSAPSDTAEVVTGARAGETYPVVAISSDGAWLQLEIERAPEGTGWVAASFVTLEGDITNIPTVEVEAAEEATEEPAAEATPEPTEEPAEEATEEPAEEATPEATAEPVEEATAEPTAEPTAEATEEPAEEATPEATEEAAEEATPQATEEPAEEATPEPTEEAAEETGEAVEPPAAGFVTIVTDGTPLRVRSTPAIAEDNEVGHVFNGETYRVLEISEDGLWVRIDVPDLGLENGGWVSTEFVVMGE
jgi:hypothetical protein